LTIGGRAMLGIGLHEGKAPRVPKASDRCDRASDAHRRDERGQALAETAIVLPLLVLLMLAMLKGGVVFHNWIVLTDAVRTSARVLSVNRAPGLDACNVARTALLNAATSLPATPTITFNVTQSCSNLTRGADATVTATLPCDMRLFGPVSACTLRATTTLRVE